MTFGEFNIRNPVHQFRNEMDRLFNGFFTPATEGWRFPPARSQLAANVWERDNDIIVEMEVPGITKEQLELSVLGSELSIRVERPAEESNDLVFHRQERPVGSFSRVLPLPSEVDANRVAAELHDGVLTITLPKTEAAKPRKIPVA